ncbi:adenosylcobinamide-phosphate synthase CbiB [Franconibacter helveticus]|uniref:adenosylcobinamide-phosphate synthase CbiB n=1 Tax=Franconibacter helveticus TaxID=357240 RepID=UPI000DA1BADB|nr:adenosylcobinamide-phosphate synthase CbiB [Franconibacter helveticus]MDU6925176.1 adenosylcobinamide-phosphate synthase CbiB [Franconibacter helveticus]
MTLLAWFIAFALDLLLGDPPRWPHPVRWVGALISRTQKVIRARCHTPRQLRAGGALLWLVVVGITFGAAFGALKMAQAIHPWFGWLLEVWMIYVSLAARCLADEARGVEQALRSGSLSRSRQQLSRIVGRDTSQLEAPQITRAVVETVAENSVDGVIAPLFFLLVGGAPLMLAYKAVNTLDSMVGYKNEKYRHIGMVSARLDDAANFIPARLSWLLLACAAAVCRLNPTAALRIGWRDRYQHSSPNCAWPEATVAGALGIRLGGPNRYFGEWVEKPWIGDARREVAVEDIPRSVRLMLVASTLALLLFALLRLAICGA